MDVQERVRELEELIRYHSDLYFNKNNPEITDAEFDVLVDELRALEPDSAVLGEVGSVPSYGKKVKHTSVMGSLNKTKIPQEVVKFAEEGSSKKDPVAIISPKMDGLAVRLNYKDGRLVEAATRGNGEVGQDVTDNVRAIKDIPKAMTSKVTCEVRGEVFMPRSVFEKLNKQLRARGEKPFANPRNAASGSLTCEDPKVTASRELSFLWYDVIPENPDYLLVRNEQQKKAWGVVNLDGLQPVPSDAIPVSQFESLALEWEAKRASLDYEIDGLVISLESLDDQDRLGWSGNCPNGKIAFKFKPQQATAPVRMIDYQVGRTGKLTPVCRIQPTYLAGSTISNIGLHNYGIVRELGLCIGDEILIEKAGDIIPQVVRVVDKHGRIESLHQAPPQTCPSCGEPVRLDAKEVNLWCVNPACPGKLEARIEHYLKTLEVLGVGPATIHSLCSAGMVKDVDDLYYLKVNSVANVLGGETMAKNVVEAILGRNQIPLWMFLDSFGIPGCGTTTSKILAKRYKTWPEIKMLVVRPGTSAELAMLENIGVLTANNILNGLRLLIAVMDRVAECVEIADAKDQTGPLKGMSFCMTGALPSGTKREVMAKKIEAAGGEVKSSVGKGLTYLVMADPNSTSGKAKSARALGVKCIGEDELMKMMGA